MSTSKVKPNTFVFETIPYKGLWTLVKVRLNGKCWKPTPFTLNVQDSKAKIIMKLAVTYNFQVHKSTSSHTINKIGLKAGIFLETFCRN